MRENRAKKTIVLSCILVVRSASFGPRKSEVSPGTFSLTNATF